MKIGGRVRYLLASCLILLIALTPSAALKNHSAIAADLAVDMTLVFAIDVSYSVDENEFRLQMDGLAVAFQDPAVHRAIMSGPHQRIAVSVTQWSGENRPTSRRPRGTPSGSARATCPPRVSSLRARCRACAP